MWERPCWWRNVFCIWKVGLYNWNQWTIWRWTTLWGDKDLVNRSITNTFLCCIRCCRRKTCQFSGRTQEGHKVAKEFASIREQTGCDRRMQRIVQTPVYFEMRQSRKGWTLDGTKPRFRRVRIFRLDLRGEQNSQPFHDSGSSDWIFLLCLLSDLAYLFEGFCVVHVGQSLALYLLPHFRQSFRLFVRLDHWVRVVDLAKSLWWVIGFRRFIQALHIMWDHKERPTSIPARCWSCLLFLLLLGYYAAFGIRWIYPGSRGLH